MSSTERDKMDNKTDTNQISLQQSSAISIDKHTDGELTEVEMDRQKPKRKGRDEGKFKIVALCGIAIIFFILGFQLSHFLSAKNSQKADKLITEQQLAPSKSNTQEAKSKVKQNNQIASERQKDKSSKELPLFPPQSNGSSEKTKENEKLLEKAPKQKKDSAAPIAINQTKTITQNKDKQEISQTKKKPNEVSSQKNATSDNRQQINVPTVPPHGHQTPPLHSHNLLKIEKNLWLFSPIVHVHPNTLNRLYYENNQHFAKEGGYNVTIVSKDNAKSLMTPKTRDRFENVAKVVGENSNIARNFALVCILADNGGIMIDDYFAFTEPMQWVENLNNDINIRRGKRTPNVEVFGYYDPKASSSMAPYDIDAQSEVQKMLRSSPGLRPYFLLAKKNAVFLTELIDEIVAMVTDSSPLTNKDGIIYFSSQDKYELDYFTNAVHRLLQKKQKKFDEAKKKGEKTQLAVDHYGLYYINELAALRKMWALFEDNRAHVQFQNLARLPKEQLYSYIGHFKYITKLTSDHEMNHLMNKLISKKIYPLVRGSFIQQVLFPRTENLTFVIDNPEKSISDPKGEPWTTLPRIIWLYWNSGHENAALSNQLAVESIKRRAKQSGFEVRLVSDKNVHLYIDNQTLARIEYTLTNAKVTVYKQSKSDFIRLALISKHGGIYFDSSYVAITNFDWIINISRYPSQYIFNRFGKHPKVLLQFHYEYGGEMQWTVNTTANTKVQWQLPMQSNFMAAQKGSEYVKQWFQMHLRLYLLNYTDVKQIYINEGGLDHTQIWGIDYLIVQDDAKAIVGRKEKQLKLKGITQYAGAVDYYKIWYFNNLMGIQHYGQRFGLQSHRQGLNTFAYQYPIQYVQAMIGSNFHLVKFYGWYNHKLNEFLNNNFNSLDKQTHPKSLLMTHMITKQIQFEYTGGRWRVKT